MQRTDGMQRVVFVVGWLSQALMESSRAGSSHNSSSIVADSASHMPERRKRIKNSKRGLLGLARRTDARHGRRVPLYVHM